MNIQLNRTGDSYQWPMISFLMHSKRTFMDLTSRDLRMDFGSRFFTVWGHAVHRAKKGDNIAHMFSTDISFLG